MLMAWVLTVALLALAVFSLSRFEHATGLTGKICTGIAAMITGVLGIVMAAALVIG